MVPLKTNSGVNALAAERVGFPSLSVLRAFSQWLLSVFCRQNIENLLVFKWMSGCLWNVEFTDPEKGFSRVQWPSHFKAAKKDLQS